MNRRQLLKGALAGTLLAGFSSCAAASRPNPAAPTDRAQTDRPPNLIFLLSDDHRWDTLGCMGNAIIQTPRLDALARDGVLFINNFATSPICVSSRASIFSGTYSGTHHVEVFGKPLPEALYQNSYPLALRRAGYRTGFIGKWGVGGHPTITPGGRVPEVERDFDYWGGYYDPDYYLLRSADGNQVQHLTRLMGYQATEFLLGCSPEQPFCLSISFKSPHEGRDEGNPFQSDPYLAHLYAETVIPSPPTADPKYFAALPGFIQESEMRNRWRRHLAPSETYQRSARDIYRLITGMDEAIGQIRQALERLGLADNTVIIYTSDNGYMMGDHGLSGKHFLFDPSIRTPLIVYDPRCAKEMRGRRCEAMTLNVDLAPTLMDLAGAPVPATMQGCSLRPLLAGGAKVPWREECYFEHRFPAPHFPKSEGVRTATIKYIRYLDVEPVYEALYDLEADPNETRNLANDRRYAGLRRQMRARWKRLRGQYTRQGEAS